MKSQILVAALLLVCVHQISGRILSRCELAKELFAQGISKFDLPNCKYLIIFLLVLGQFWIVVIL